MATADYPKRRESGHPSIEQLCNNVCEMKGNSEESSPSPKSLASDIEDLRIDSELNHLVGMNMTPAELAKENDGSTSNAELSSNSAVVSPQKKSSTLSHMQTQYDQSMITSLKDESSPKPSIKKKVLPRSASANSKLTNESVNTPDLGPFLLKQARGLIADDPKRALRNAIRAAKSFEAYAGKHHNLDLTMCLHVIAAIHCKLGQYDDAISVLQRSIDIPAVEEGGDHAIAKFSGYMLLGDTYALLGQFDSSILCYRKGLEVQTLALGEKDLRVGETCRYLAEAYVQAMQLDEAQKWCQLALDIHRQKDESVSVHEIADRRLMGLICDTKGDHEAALEHLVLASMAMVSSGQDAEIGPVDLSIGDAYLSLARYDEAVFAYQKALTMFRTLKGETHPAVASVYVRLADLYNKMGKFREAKSYCEIALSIYTKPCRGTSSSDIAYGLVDISAIYESMNEHEQALKMLNRALKAFRNAQGQQSTIAGIEAQRGAIYYMIGKYDESYNSFKNAIMKFRACGEMKSAFFGILLNQMGLTCVHRLGINEAAEMFEEARIVLEEEYGPYHPSTLGVYSNLAGTYDAIGRLSEAVEILECLVAMREEKLGTANPEVDDEKRRLAELLKEVGRPRRRRNKSLENLFDANNHLLVIKKRFAASQVKP